MSDPSSSPDRLSAVLTVGLNEALGLRFVDAQDPQAGLAMPVEGLAATPFGGAHAAAIQALLDVCCFVEVIPHLAEDEHAVSVATSFQLIGATPPGSTLVATATIDRRTRKLAFLTAEARIDGEVVSRAQVTKAVVRVR
ncbi:PaaI family thioesterase [Nocardioidaceae bacterium]|nr:PaaI family thioesterase [Nocardioidaceae bacterium]